MATVIPMGIDVGASDVKAIADHTAEGIVFRSAIAPHAPNGLLLDGRKTGGIRIVSGRKSTEYFYGELGAIHGVGVPTILGQYRLEGPETLALYLAAILELVKVEKAHVKAVVGIPASLANDPLSKERLTKTLNGVHHIESLFAPRNLEVELEVLQVMSQPNGTAFHFLTDWDGNQDPDISAEGQIAVLDIGGETTDVTRMTNVVVDRSDSLRYGMRDVENSVATEILHQHGIVLDAMSKRSAIETRVVYVGGVKTDVSSIVNRHIATASELMIRFFLSTLKTSGDELRYILLTGGGAKAMAGPITRRFPQTRLMNSPAMANAMGFAKKAVRLSRA